MKSLFIGLFLFSSLAQASEVVWFSGGFTTTICDYAHCHGTTSSWVSIEIEVNEQNGWSGEHWFPRESYRGMEFDRGISVTDWGSTHCLVTFYTYLNIGQNTEKRTQAVSCEDLYRAKKHRLEEPYKIGEYTITSSIYVEMEGSSGPE